MSNLLTGSFQLMKSLNRSVILNMIRSQGPISRAEIAKRTKLTPPTVSNLVKELIETDIVIESEQGVSQGGRRPTMLVINASNFYIVGLDVGPTSVMGILTDLNASTFESFTMPLSHSETNDSLLLKMGDTVDRLLSRPTILNKERLLGIGIAMHGIVDSDEGLSIFAPILHLKNIPIKAYLEHRFNLHVKVENDARTMALGEAWFGVGGEVPSFMVINIGLGVGAGLVVDGRLHHGVDFLSGEIGHMTIDLNGPLCSCGNKGCLQAMTSGPYIAERAKELLSNAPDSLLFNLVKDDLDKITSETVYQAATQGDALSIALFKEIGFNLGVGLCNVIHTINPFMILIGGGVSKASHLLLDPVKDTLQERGLTEQAKKTPIRTVSLGDRTTVIGACALILSELFQTQGA